MTWLEKLPELLELDRHVDCVQNKNLRRVEESVDSHDRCRVAFVAQLVHDFVGEARWLLTSGCRKAWWWRSAWPIAKQSAYQTRKPCQSTLDSSCTCVLCPGLSSISRAPRSADGDSPPEWSGQRWTYYSRINSWQPWVVEAITTS